jgi:hypothetical protein
MSKPETKFVDPKFFATAEGLAMLRAQLAEARANPQPKETVQAVEAVDMMVRLEVTEPQRRKQKGHWM